MTSSPCCVTVSDTRERADSKPIVIASSWHHTHANSPGPVPNGDRRDRGGLTFYFVTAGPIRKCRNLTTVLWFCRPKYPFC